MSGIGWAEVPGLLLPFLALVLMAIAWIAYARQRTSRVLLWAGAFTVYFLKTLLTGTRILFSGPNDWHEGLGDLADLAILALLFVGTTRK